MVISEWSYIHALTGSTKWTQVEEKEQMKLGGQSSKNDRRDGRGMGEGLVNSLYSYIKPSVSRGSIGHLLSDQVTYIK